MPTPTVDTAAVRAWAQQQGIQVGVRGRLPGAVVEQYLADGGAGTNAANTRKQPAKPAVAAKPAKSARAVAKPKVKAKATRSAPATSTETPDKPTATPRPEDKHEHAELNDLQKTVAELKEQVAGLQSDLTKLAAREAELEKRSGWFGKRQRNA